MAKRRMDTNIKSGLGHHALVSSVAATLLLCGCAELSSKPDAMLPAEFVPQAELLRSSPHPETASHSGRAGLAIVDCCAYVAPELPEPEDLWVRIRGGFQLEPALNRRIQSHIDWFLRNPSHLNRALARGEPYLYHIVQQLTAAKLPLELVLLPVIESAYQPFAYSHGRAAGIWQFIPSTGRRYGLKQDWWYDGRRDIYAATDAAIRLLSALNKEFNGDWALSLAAYNAGGAKVRRAIRNNQRAGLPTDFFSLKLPKETMGYVPRFLALTMVVAAAESHGVTLKPIANRPYFASVELDAQVDLAVAAELAELPIEQMYSLNPGFNRWATPPEGKHRLLITVDKADQLRDALAALPTNQRLNWRRHKIEPGQTLSLIAQRYRTTAQHLRQVNKLRSNTIRAGKYLLVPAAATAASHYSLSADARRQANEQQQHKGNKRIHVVKKGDTLWELARQYGVSMHRLAHWNSMAPRDTLKPGRRLVLWLSTDEHSSRKPSQSPFVQSIRYQVKPGDSLHRIAQRFRVPLAKLKQWNQKLSQRKYLHPGQQLRLEVDIRKTSGAS